MVVSAASNFRRPLALGIHWAHDAAVTLCSSEGIIFSVAEERIARIKHYYGFPYRSIELALKACGLTSADIDFIAISTSHVLFPEHANTWVVNAKGDAVRHATAVSPLAQIKKSVKQALGMPIATKQQVIDWQESWGKFADRHWANYVEFMQGLGLMDERIAYYYVAHHRAHAASAFRLGGLPEATVITIDGKGDGLSATIYKGHASGRMELIRSSAASASLGALYQAATEALGFIPVDGEYKTMGLAAIAHDNGQPNPFSNIVRVEDGLFESSIHWTYRDYNAQYPQKAVANPLKSITETDQFTPLLEGLSREQFAYFIQAECEALMLEYARDALRLTGVPHLMAAGGVMLNVKANALIRDTLNPASFFVFPDSGDSGLSAGAAMEALYQSGHLTQQPRFKKAYQGHEYSHAEIEAALAAAQAKHALNIVKTDHQSESVVAQNILKNKVIGTFQGRLEMGPRALGNRSVIADARSNEMKDRINLILKGREWFVPFAPIVLEEDAHLYWSGATDYRYMTFAVKASDYAHEHVPAVVHVDGTMRPQIVSPDYNPWLYEVLQAYKKETGIGVLINTSFNRHGLPIVGSPEDAIEHLVNGWVDALIIGEFYVECA